MKDLEQVELFDNPNYDRIVRILRRGESTIKEIHELFNKDYEDKKTLTSIYRYMEKLVEHGLVYVSKEELKRGHLIERYYSRTARFFLFEGERSFEDTINASCEFLQQIYSLDTEEKEELKKLLRELARDMEKYNTEFYEKHGNEILEEEKEVGYEAARHAANLFSELLYFRKNPELIGKLLKILGEKRTTG